ncbi:L,D-transpeptidase [Yinghuangia soli]|uniref:Ig-like domain-containing protein n=1 Tax=Yinghuangia soli TaxID=2908204 RepID=A0AA41Q0F9_9ACTN|nr:Ig-like domain-containing protein [Yinghuangia soli]MCF2528144.1 Ig-like domain-containing protein [Yinghuangia soli]
MSERDHSAGDNGAIAGPATTTISVTATTAAGRASGTFRGLPASRTSRVSQAARAARAGRTARFRARRRTASVVAALAVALVAVSGCTGDGKKDGGASAGSSAGVSGASDSQAAGASSAPAAAPATLVITPADGSAKVAPGLPVMVTAQGGTVGSVIVKAEDGSLVDGNISDDAASWRTSGALHTNTKYTVTATATNAAGVETKSTAAFSTAQAGKTMTYQVNISGLGRMGVGMPVSVTFDTPVKDRAAVERALSVTADPPVAGSWSWVKDRNLADGQRIDFRPQEYWKPGTKISFFADLDGVDTGGGRFAIQDVKADVTVARSLVATVDVKTHKMTVVEDGKPDSVIPITAGEPGRDTWNGTMVVMDRNSSVYMDSRTVNYGNEYQGYYNWALHTTASGTYVHENPRAIQFAGKQNITHGCVGLAADGTAKKFYDRVIVGDVIKVMNSASATVEAGNGYGGWNVAWDKWQAGSALAAR